MFIAFFISFISFFTPAQADWKELTSLRIYRYVSSDKALDSISQEEISKMPFGEADVEEAKKILSLATKTNKMLLWKSGGTLAIATFADGSTARLRISNYGGFFYNSKSKASYIFSEEDHQIWDRFIAKYSPE